MEGVNRVKEINAIAETNTAFETEAAWMTNFPNVEVPKFIDSHYDIRDYGAVEGGFTSNTEAINNAVKAASAAGGGRVVIPAGLWLTGPVRLLSNVDLHTECGALVQFSYDPEEYPLVAANYEGTSRIRARSPLYALDAENIGITGEGIFDGGGQRWRPVKKFKTTDKQWQDLLSQGGVTAGEGGECVWFPSQSACDGYYHPDIAPEEENSLERAQEYYDFYRPVLCSLVRCKRVLIEGVTLQNSPAWNLHPLFCEHVTVRNATIKNPWYAQNGDGLDLESCRYVNITHTSFDVGDDGICMKSGKNAPARQIDFPTEYVTIEDCTVFHGHGGFVVGSEMSRGVRNVLVKNCCFIGTDVGIRFKSTLGRGGVVENIVLDGIRMIGIQDQAVIFTMGYSSNGAPKADCSREDIPEFKNIAVKNMVCRGCGQAVVIDGLKQQPIHDISFENVKISGKKGLKMNCCERIALSDVTLFDEGGNQVREHYEQALIGSGEEKA